MEKVLVMHFMVVIIVLLKKNIIKPKKFLFFYIDLKIYHVSMI